MNKRKSIINRTALTICVTALLLQGCGTMTNNPGNSMEPGSQITDNPAQLPETNQKSDSSGISPEKESDTQAENSQADTAKEQNIVPPIDLKIVKPNETGRIMVVMFHNFVEEYKSGDKEYTTTFNEFEKLLDTLYNSEYRLIGMNDYLNGNIDIPAGCIPMVFTFDDGTAGQFNLIEEGGILVANPRSAVGIIEEFNKTHPGFGTRGVFYINLGNQTFKGAGTLAQRLEYLKNKGFELGNHTYSHINLKKTGTAETLLKEIGGNQKKMYELIQDYTFTTLSLPFGAPSKDLTQYVIKGEFEGIRYENLGIMEVGWDPAPSPYNVEFDALSIHRVRASGIKPVDQDLAWWLDNLKRDRQYISDGNAAQVTVPKDSMKYLEQARLNGRELVDY